MKYIVGVGASAGGLEALKKFFENMPIRKDVSFVVVQHLSPDYKSLMDELLAKYTTMPIIKVENQMVIQPGCIYLIPAKKHMTIINNTLYLRDFDSLQKLNLPIDVFLHSLAEDKGARAVGIILSGTGSDGTNGIRSIKEYGGLVMVQDEFSAKFDGMPKSAIYTGLVDYILPPEQMGNRLSDYLDSHSETVDGQPHESDEEGSLAKIYLLVKKILDLDLTYYKQKTILRRLERRMSIHKIKTLHDYYAFLKNNVDEAQTLCNELMIGVTRFFRDTQAFDHIANTVIPEIVNGKKPGESIRVWIAGCSTGEEAYSLAMLVQEHLRKTKKKLDVKVFASDIDKNAIEFASTGLYPSSIAADVPIDLLGRYFQNTGGYYQVSKKLRETMIFAKHNLIKDPPFNKLDLISCRNLLIYLQRPLQKKVLSLFDYSLNYNGFLFLGSSETTGDLSSSFITVESRWRIYRHKGSGGRLANDLQFLSTDKSQLREATEPAIDLYKNKVPRRPLEHLQRILVSHYLPPSVIVDESYNVVLICGGGNRFLSVPPGQPTYRVTDMLATEASILLMAALRKVFKDEVTKFKYQHRDSREYSSNVEVVVEVLKKSRTKLPLAMITFNVLDQIENAKDSSVELDSQTSSRMQEIEHELQYTKESLQATIEELETSNEELQATNEELLSSNEELQSTNEELQSVNEELVTLNSEYQMKITELTDLNNDIDNFISSTNIGTLFLDKDLNIRKFTPAVASVINLMEQDVGRPVGHISHNLINSNIIADAEHVLKTLVPIEKEVERSDGQTFLQTVFPYRTKANMIKGVVITFVNITEIRNMENQLDRLPFAIGHSPLMLVVTETDGTVRFINNKFIEVTGYQREDIIGKDIRIIRSGQVNNKVYSKMWETLESGVQWRGELINVRKNGDLYCEYATISPVTDVSGTIVHHVKVAEEKCTEGTEVLD